MNIRGVIFFLGVYTLLISILSFFNVLYSLYFSFNLDINSYILTLVISLFLGSLFCLIGKNNTKNINFYDQIIIIFISYIFLPLILSLPYFFSSYNFSLVNSYFESISGFTTTGFTIIGDVEIINEPLLLWRSSTQWIGGLIFLLATIGTLGNKRIKIKPVYLISEMDISGNFFNNFRYNFLRIAMIYGFTTILIIVIFKIFNVRLFDSFNLAFTTVSSGGFLSKNSLNNITSSNLQIFILSICLLFPILNFYLLFKIITREFIIKNYLEDLHLLSIIFLTTLFFYFFVIPTDNLSNILLYVTSSISTSGISVYTADKDISLFFLLLALIGGSLISTSSGLKYVRIYILLKISYQEIYKLVKPINVFNRNLFNVDTKISNEDSNICFFIFISFILSMFILSGLLTLENFTFDQAVKLSILTLTNTTASSLYGMENIGFINLTTFTKLNLIIFMILGKIEIIALFFLIKGLFFKE